MESTQLEILHRDKSILTVLWNSATIFETDGHTPVATVAQGQDITKRKEYEQSLKENELRLKERIKELKGLYQLGLLAEKEENLDNIYNEFVTKILPESLQFPEQVFVLLKLENKTYCNIENYKLPEYRQFLSVPFKLFGKQTGELMVAYTEELPFMDPFEPDLITNYSLRIAKITERIITREILSERESRLQKLNTDKDLFISILSHDLRSPFNAFLGLTQFLTENIHELGPDEIKSSIDQINKSAQKTFTLLEDILFWAKSASGKVPFSPQKLIFENICTDATDVLNQIAVAKKITINFSFPEETTVFADKEMLKAIIRNLVSNAIKFTKRAGRINISSIQTDSEIIISVSDNGIGMTASDSKKLFDLSQMITTKGTAEEEGTGIGLLICKNLVEKHGGTIRVESEPGKGSEFIFSLPLGAEPGV